MPNAFWYALLALLATAIFLYALGKQPWRQAVALYGFIAGLTYSAEYIVLVLLYAYEYRPLLLSDPYYDNMLGAFVSDAFVIPMTCVLVAMWPWNWLRSSLVALVIAGVEELFLFLGIYEHTWWTTLFTEFGAVTWLLIARWMHVRLQSPLSTGVRFSVVFMAGFFFRANLFFGVMGILDLFAYRSGWFSDFARGSISFSGAYVGISSLLFTAVVVFRQPWTSKVLAAACLVVTDWFLWENGILIFSRGWSVWHAAALNLAVLALMTAFHDHIVDSPRRAAVEPRRA